MKPNRQSRLAPSQNSRAAANGTLESKAEEGGIPQVSRLKIGKSDDAFEKEADHMADVVVDRKAATSLKGFATPQVMLMKKDDEESQAKMETVQRSEEEKAKTKPESIQRMEDTEEGQAKFEMAQPKGEEEEAKTKADSPRNGNRASLKTTQTVKATKGNGSPLSEGPKRFMEKGFGADFSKVRIHTDHKAEAMSKEMGAQAFTVGNDIYFNKGRFNPETQSGKKLLAHELTHTIQQKRK